MIDDILYNAYLPRNTIVRLPPPLLTSNSVTVTQSVRITNPPQSPKGTWIEP